ncbi:hypothetical protein Q5M85_21040 [Paraclostridium bifermentans]|nr:hypothetical protein [Paraclostridium bifermentans]
MFNSKEDAPKIGCIEAPTGIGKSVGYLIPAIMESFIMERKLLYLQIQKIYRCNL